MSTHKQIDRICVIALVIAMVVTVLFMNGSSFGITAQAMTGYEKRLFDTSKVHQIDIVMDDWDGFLETCENEEYTVCALVIDGEAYKNIGIRAKGNTSLSNVKQMNSDRYSLKIEFDHYNSAESYYGLDKLCLNNIIQDNTYMKDYLSYQLMSEAGVPSPLCSYAYITVNGEDWGLYLAVEDVEDAFLERNYGSDYGELYKPDSMSMGGGRGNGKDFDMDAFREKNAQDGGDDAEDSQDTEMSRPKPGGEGMPQPPELPDGADLSQMPELPDGAEMPQPPQMSGGENTQNVVEPADGGNSAVDSNASDAWNGTTGQETSEARNSEENTDSADSQEQPQDLGGRGGMKRPDFGGNEDGNGGGAPGSFPGGFGNMFGSSDVKLQYIDDDPDSYANIFDNAKTDITKADKKRLIQSLKSLGEGENIGEVVNVDEVIRYFVVHNFVCNGDSYTGSMIHNYYLYEEDGQLSMIPWDYNLAFGSFQEQDATAQVNSPIDTPVSGGSMDDRPMVAWIFADETYTQLYHQYFSEFLEQVDLSQMIRETETLIAPYVEKDPTKFCTYEEFETGVDAIEQFCELRAESVKGQLEGTIPSTTDGQSADDANLVDASDLNLSDMGSMDMGGGRNEMRQGGRNVTDPERGTSKN